jgi:two-component system sensor histidine kinase RpfC
MYRFIEPTPIPILILSANVTQELVKQCENAGAAEFLAKPLRASILLDAIERQLAERADQFTRAASVSTRGEERPSLTVIDTPPFDPSVLEELSHLSSDPTFVERLLLGVRSDCTRLVQEIQEALAHRRYDAARDSAHALKGGAGGVGATWLFQFVALMEKLPPELLRMKAAQLSEELTRITSHTLQLLDNSVLAERERRSPGATT